MIKTHQLKRIKRLLSSIPSCKEDVSKKNADYNMGRKIGLSDNPWGWSPMPGETIEYLRKNIFHLMDELTESRLKIDELNKTIVSIKDAFRNIK